MPRCREAGHDFGCHHKLQMEKTVNVTLSAVSHVRRHHAYATSMPPCTDYSCWRPITTQLVFRNSNMRQQQYSAGRRPAKPTFDTCCTPMIRLQRFLCESKRSIISCREIIVTPLTLPVVAAVVPLVVQLLIMIAVPPSLFVKCCFPILILELLSSGSFLMGLASFIMHY